MSALTPSAGLLNSRLVTKPFAGDQLVLDRMATGEGCAGPSKPGGLRAQIRGASRFGAKARQMRNYESSRTRGRKRCAGGDGRLPNIAREWFTEGERAVLSVIGREVKRYGECTLPIARIAKLAGVGIRLVQYTLASARRGCRQVSLGKGLKPQLINVDYRRERGAVFNETNRITIVCRAWLAHLHYRPSEDPRRGCRDVHAFETDSLRPLSTRENEQSSRPSRSSQWALEDERAGSAAKPPDRPWQFAEARRT